MKLSPMLNLVPSIIHISLWLVHKASAQANGCPSSSLTFKIVTGYVYTAPDDTLELIPGTLHLPECLNYCRINTTCQSVNFETGLCVLFSSSAKDKPDSLTSSQFPVFTIYAHKLCLKRVQPCNRQWSFEAVFGTELLDRSRKKATVKTVTECMELCLEETAFECRSANYHKDSNECILNDADRHSVSPHRLFVPAEENTQYLENNCVESSSRLCEFRKISGKILKTVDAVYQDVKTLDACRRKCLEVDFRCQTFDMGDPTNSVCRLSHLSSASLTHIQDPYLEIPGAVTFETAACYNVTIRCRSREMVAFVRTSRIFNGKVYARSRPNSCVTDVLNSLEFEIRMAYHDLDCDVKQDSNSEFSNDIVIQHHDMIVTNQDLGLTVHCHYELANRSVIADGLRIDMASEVRERGVHAVVVGSPNVTMSVTDREGRDTSIAQVGDPLALFFQVTDHDSPYEIFIRELVAMDGVDNSEILLIDALGCPTDPLVMGAVNKINQTSRNLMVPFDAFKFPTSEIVQFKALVTPCISRCDPAQCDSHTEEGASVQMQSLGKRRRRRRATSERKHHEDMSGKGSWGQNSATPEEEVVVVKTIRITDKFGFDKDHVGKFSEDGMSFIPDDIGEKSDANSCFNIAGIVISCSLFLVAQLIVLLAYAFIIHKRKSRRSRFPKEISDRSIDMIFNHRRGDSSCPESFSFDNPYRSDITPYDSLYSLPRPQTRHY